MQLCIYFIHQLGIENFERGIKFILILIKLYPKQCQSLVTLLSSKLVCLNIFEADLKCRKGWCITLYNHALVWTLMQNQYPCSMEHVVYLICPAKNHTLYTSAVPCPKCLSVSASTDQLIFEQVIYVTFEGIKWKKKRKTWIGLF